jgi:hypothetical protein
MLVAVIVKPRPRPKLRKQSHGKKWANNPIETALAMRSKYPRTRLEKKLFPTRSAPRAEPEN